MTQITKADSFRLRGFAIFIIMVHNFLHNISSWPGENEYSFDVRKADSFLSLIGSEPENIITLLASYFGHYGVHLFVFLSAYGLARKYTMESQLPTGSRGSKVEVKRLKPDWWQFQKSRWTSLFPTIILAALTYLIYDGTRLGFLLVIQNNGLNLLSQIIGIANFIPENTFHPIGPWWFISLILQLYLLFPLLLTLGKKISSRSFLVIIALVVLFEYRFSAPFYYLFGVNINFTALGHLDTFLFGIFLAQRGDVKLPKWIVFLAAPLFIIGSVYGPLWIISGLAFVIITYSGGLLFSKHATHYPKIDRVILRLGELSFYLFLINGFLRKPLFTLAQTSQNWLTSLWTCALFLLICLFVALILEDIEKKCRRFFTKKTIVQPTS